MSTWPELLAKLAPRLAEVDADPEAAEARLLEAQSDYDTIATTIEHFEGGSLAPVENEVLITARREAAQTLALRALVLWRAHLKEET